MTNLKVRESQKIYIGKKVGPCLQNFPTEDTLLNERLIINYELITVFELVSSILLGLWGQGGRVEVWAFKSLSRLNFEGWSMKWKFSNIRICSNLFLIWLEPQSYVTKYSASIRLNCISDLKMVANSRLKASISQSLKHFFLQ